MGKVYKIGEDCFVDSAFSLYAIHTQMEEFALAYTLNEVLNSRLIRCAQDLVLENAVSFPVYEWNDEINYRYWILYKNKESREKIELTENLFSSITSRTNTYLIPEKKEVDYFLKVESEIEEQNLLVTLLSVPKILTAYEIDAGQLKSKSNLIF